MRTIYFLIISLFCHLELGAQELFTSTEPASAMPAKSIGIRVTNELFPLTSYETVNKSTMYRLSPEVMWGISKNWMVHLNFYASDCHQNSFKAEGIGTYIKYRFFAHDEVQSHFRMAIYGRASLVNNPIQYEEINLGGDNSGAGIGIIATQLLHKIAFSFTGGYLRATDNIGYLLNPGQVKDELNYSLSAGWLCLPVEYKNYSQPNLNLFVEFLGKANPTTNESYLDIAPAMQLIINSLTRIDLVYEKQLYGNMLRIDNRQVSLRFEYSFLNAYK